MRKDYSMVLTSIVTNLDDALGIRSKIKITKKKQWNGTIFVSLKPLQSVGKSSPSGITINRWKLHNNKSF